MCPELMEIIDPIVCLFFLKKKLVYYFVIFLLYRILLIPLNIFCIFYLKLSSNFYSSLSLSRNR